MKENISKKRSFIETLWKKSTEFQVSVAICIISLFVILDFFMVRLELHFNLILADDIPFTFIVNIFLIGLSVSVIVLIIALIVAVAQTLWMLLRYLPHGIRKLKAIYRYCFIPLTEDEIREYRFTSVKDYFEYVKEELHYGLLDKDEEFIEIDIEDFRKMLVTSAAVFGEKEVFLLNKTDFEFFTRYDIKFFFDNYSKCLKQGNVRTGSEKVKVKNSGRVKLSYETRSKVYKEVNI